MYHTRFSPVSGTMPVSPHTTHRRSRLLYCLALWSLLCGLSPTVLAGTGDDSVPGREAVAHVLALAEAPPGVVFEIASRDERALEWAVPAVRRHAAALRKRFPGLAIAVVTHGREQFALQRQQSAASPALHQAVRTLVEDEAVTLHVCETYANRRGISAEDFPDYVNVAAEGPAQVQNYEALGYIRIRLRAR